MQTSTNNTASFGAAGPSVQTTGYMVSSPPVITKALIFSKMSAVQKDIGSVGKDSTNTMQGFKFRGIDQFINALYPALTRHGVFMTTRVLNHTSELREVTRSNGKAGVDNHVSLTMEYTFHAEDGSTVVSTMPGSAIDSGDKATNKALSAALKYALIQTFSIPTVDMAEGDFDSTENGIPVKQNVLVGSVGTQSGSGTIMTPAVEIPKKTTFRKPQVVESAPSSATAPLAVEEGWK